MFFPPQIRSEQEKSIEITPLSPYLDKELLGNNSLAIDGSAIEATGFKYEVPSSHICAPPPIHLLWWSLANSSSFYDRAQVPEFTEAKLREWVDYYTKLKLFPEGFLN